MGKQINPVDGQVKGDLEVVGSLTVGGNISLTGDLTLDDATIGDDLGVTGDVDVSGVLSKLGASGEQLDIKVASVLLDTDSGAGTETAAGLIPAGSLLLGVCARVVTVVAGAGLGSFDIGDGSDQDRFGAAIALAADTTVDLADSTALPLGLFASGGDIVLTADAGQFDSGQVRISAFYIDLIAPTS